MSDSGPARRRHRTGEAGEAFKTSNVQQDLFGGGRPSRAADALRNLHWPSTEEFPTNHPGHRVHDVVWNDLVASANPLLIAGYSSIARLVELICAWADERHDGQLRFVLGAEPFGSHRPAFHSDRIEFTDEARKYWIEDRGISLRLSAKVIRAIEELDAGRIDARFIHGETRLHAKIFVGDAAATVGSSNFTRNGLEAQFEANARFDASRRGGQSRHRDLRQIAENYWTAGETWNEELRSLLDDLLKVVTWREALARACAELLTGSWADRYMERSSTSNQPLWPSQTAGIAEALWIMENVGSVLVADATGSGKTRMGAHLVRAARDRLWRTGRVRHDLTVLVGPPTVIKTWDDEALEIGLNLRRVSHGRLSRSGGLNDGRDEKAVRGAQILALDEAHNFLNAGSKRTQRVRDSLADNVLLFTATPISRGASDILTLVGLLGPDNFDDATLEILSSLDSRRGPNRLLTADEMDDLRKEIQRFTVRRTKSQINEMVERDEEPFRDRATGRVARYPQHQTKVYKTCETAEDDKAANRVRALADGLVGITQFEERVVAPKGWAHGDEQWLRFRRISASGLARHHVLETLRSSRAALLEHLAGTTAAAESFRLDQHFKPTDTGDVLAKVHRLAGKGPPVVDLDCEVDPWLVDPVLWQEQCKEEWSRYEEIRRELVRISDAREKGKVDLLVERFRDHGLVLAFDRHPITLAVLEAGLLEAGVPRDEVLFATGQKEQKKKVIDRFAPSGTGRAIAVCSDALNEGLNLQRASCIVHLDLPTTLRVAEQRVGRIDRMNSPHDEIESWWPDDGQTFATRAYEKLARRAQESRDLLGANLSVPDLDAAEDGRPVTVHEHLAELERSKPTAWDGIRDALDPVRQLVSGEAALIDQATYAAFRDSRHRVLCRVSPVISHRPWAFFAVAAVAQGAPRWILIDHTEAITDLDEVAARLRELLADDPPSRELDKPATDALGRFLDAATRAERRLLPRRMLKALDQMVRVTSAWAKSAQADSDEVRATRWREVGRLASPDERLVDPYRVAECWIDLVTPALDRFREQNRNARYVTLRQIESGLRARPLPYEKVAAAFQNLASATPLEDRVTSCIIGLPEKP